MVIENPQIGDGQIGDDQMPDWRWIEARLVDRKPDWRWTMDISQIRDG